MSIIAFKGWLVAKENPTVSQDLLPKETHSEALSPVPTANKTTHSGPAPRAGENGLLSASARRKKARSSSSGLAARTIL